MPAAIAMFDIESLTLAAIALAVAEIIGVLLAVDAVMRRRSSQGAVAWSVALVAMPGMFRFSFSHC